LTLLFFRSIVKIGCLSDTHIPDRASTLHPDIIRVFKERGVDMILHAGDLTSPKVLDVLDPIAPTKVVRGNMDGVYKKVSLPPEEVFELKGTRWLMFHGSGIYPRGDTQQIVLRAKDRGCPVVVTGHTHAPFFKEIDGVTIINPGSTADKRMGRTFMVLEVDGQIRPKLYELD
jgi:putative phosphoesterase